MDLFLFRDGEVVGWLGRYEVSGRWPSCCCYERVMLCSSYVGYEIISGKGGVKMFFGWKSVLWKLSLGWGDVTWKTPPSVDSWRNLDSVLRGMRCMRDHVLWSSSFGCVISWCCSSNCWCFRCNNGLRNRLIQPRLVHPKPQLSKVKFNKSWITERHFFILFLKSNDPVMIQPTLWLSIVVVSILLLLSIILAQSL